MNDPRSEQKQFYAWLLGVVCGAVAVLLAGLYLVVTNGLVP